MKIHAYAALSPCTNLVPFEYEKDIGPDGVLVEVTYASLSRGDAFFIDNFWKDSKYPLVPGGEIYGIIKEKGSHVKDFEIGDYVGMGYQMSSCMKCRYCLEGKEQFCHDQKVLMIDGFGGMADYIIFDHRFVFKIPQKLQSPEYVPLLSSGLTVYSAIKKGQAKAGMKVGVVGIGNLGHFAIQILNKLGCKVTAFSHSLHKKEDFVKLGAKHFVDSTKSTALEAEKGKYDLIVSTSSYTLDWPAFVKALTPQGNIVFVGLPEKDIAFPAVLLADYAQRGVLGSYVGSRQEMKELLEFAEKHDIKAISQVFSINKVNEALETYRQGKNSFSTVIEIKK